jgi:cell wall-associated NlpC family hydrolase
MCQRFFRQVRQRAYGHKYDQFDAKWAVLAARKWNKTGYSLLPDVTLKIGDVVYWSATLDNPFGHVAIYIGNHRVIHNSILNRFSPNKWKGISDLRDMRPYHVIVRLPA